MLFPFLKSRRMLCILLALAMALTLAPVSAAFAHADDPPEAERPMQSGTEFVVALDPDFAGEVLAGQAELFMVEADDAGQAPDRGGDRKLRKIKSGLLKRGSDARETHLRSLERHKERRLADAPVLITVEAASSDKMQEAMAAVEMSEGVLFAEPLVYFYADEFDDTYAQRQWGLTPVDAYDAWDGNANLSSIVIAILDTGVRLTHEDLAASIVPGYDFVDQDADPTDLNGHGTHVAGIAAAISNNGKGVASPAGGAKILPVRVLDASGAGTSESVANGIYFAADRGAHIINMSLGSHAYSSIIESAVNYALGKGCLVVAASGNDYRKNAVSYPAAINGVIVAASLSENPGYIVIESDFSNYSPAYASRTIHAPGAFILSTDYAGDASYSIMSGTSMAAPLVSGMAAALLARGGFTGSLFNKLLNETVSMPRYYASGSRVLPDPSGAPMKVLNDNGNMDTYKNMVFTVTFGGSGYPIPETQYVKFGERVATPAASPVLPGYDFLGWKRSGESRFYDFSSPVYSNFTINATWEFVQTHRVTVLGGSNGNAFANVREAESGTAITVIATPNSGYSFKEWRVVSGSPAISNPAANPASFAMPRGAVAVQAVFEPVASTGRSIELPFVPADAVSNGDGSVIYFSDKEGKKVHSIDTATLEQKSIPFSLMPESMHYKDGKLYVSLCEWEHSNFRWTEDQRGAFAIVDCASFTVTAQRSIGIDPYSIAVSNAGNIYISSGSGQWTEIHGYSQGGALVARGQVYNRSPIKYNSELDRIYAITTNTSPRNMSAYIIQPDGTFYDRGGNMGTYYNWPYHGTISAAVNFKISPDDKYIFNAAGYVLQCKQAQAEDMVRIQTLDRSYVDIAFDLGNNTYYASMTNKNIHSFSYDTFQLQKTYTAFSGTPERIFLSASDVVAVTKGAENNYYIELIAKNSTLTGLYSVNVSTTGNGAAAANVSVAKAGDLVTIVAMPDSGNDLEKWEAVSGNVTLADAHAQQTTFLMPEGNVSVRAVFERVAPAPESGAVLTFEPADAVSSDDGAFVYLSDKERKRVYRVNTATFEQEYIPFSLMPESMFFKNGKLYVSLCEREHSSYWQEEDQRGAYAVVDGDPFTVISQHIIDVDPYDIVVSNDDIVYISSGSGQWTYIFGFDQGGNTVAKGQIRQTSPIEYNSALNKIYAITTDVSPQNMSAYTILSDNSFSDRGGNMGTSYNWPYHGNFLSEPNFKVSPDGKYIFNGIGYILACTATQAGDMVKLRDLASGFRDIAFDLSNNKYYTAPYNNRREVLSFNYGTHAQLDAYAVLYGAPERVFLAGEEIVALTRTENNVYYIERAKTGFAADSVRGAVSITGAAQFGQQLVVDVTGLTSGPDLEPGSFTYQWKRAGANIAGAAGATYRPALADIGQALTVTVTAKNLVGSITSAPTPLVAKADGPAAPAAPSKSQATPGSITLSAIPGAEYIRVTSYDWGEPGGIWQDSVTFGGLAPDKEYVFAARIKGTTTHEASAISAFSAPIATARAAAPTPTPAPSINYPVGPPPSNASPGASGSVTPPAQSTVPTPPTSWQDPAARANPFADVTAGAWYYSDVMSIYRKGLITGTSPDKFDPNATLTRGMIVTVLYRHAGSPDQAGPDKPFNDAASGAWYSDAVRWAASSGLAAGYSNGSFGVGDPITRQDLAVILLRYMGYLKVNLQVTQEFIYFADGSDVSDYAMGAVQTLYKLGVIGGGGTNEAGQAIISPKGNATRAEVSAMLNRFFAKTET